VHHIGARALLTAEALAEEFGNIGSSSTRRMLSAGSWMGSNSSVIAASDVVKSCKLPPARGRLITVSLSLGRPFGERQREVD